MLNAMLSLFGAKSTSAQLTLRSWRLVAPALSAAGDINRPTPTAAITPKRATWRNAILIREVLTGQVCPRSFRQDPGGHLPATTTIAILRLWVLAPTAGPAAGAAP